MRCKNCGYVNDDNAVKCIKCNADLRGSMSSASSTRCETGEEFQPARTVMESSGSLNSNAGTQVETGGRRHRPEPGTPSPARNEGVYPPAGAPFSGTINPWQQQRRIAGCWLKPLDAAPNQPPVCCNGNEFALTRANTNPADATISSHQALLSHDATGWYIEDQSTYHSTAIVVSRRTRLEEGDVVVLGSSRFVFTEQEPDRNS